MYLKWRRGLFRLWIVASVLWFIGIFFYITYESSQTAERFARINCKRELLTGREFDECHRHMRTPAGRELYLMTQDKSQMAADPTGRQQKMEKLRLEMERDRTWARSSLEQNWPFIVAAPFVFLLFGATIAGTLAWIGRGFI